LVALTDGVVKFKMLTWNGSSRNAPETPPMDVRVETKNATSGGMKTQVSTPDTGKCAYRKSMQPPLEG
jgi:hypothetical protein